MAVVAVRFELVSARSTGSQVGFGHFKRS